jgi:nucleoside 2-deoxyribosyltransferase
LSAKVQEAIIPEKSKKTCFIITPVGGTNSEIRRHIDGVIKEAIFPVLEQLNFQRSETVYETSISGSLVRTIVRSIYEADLVIANLTEQNPNVMYEIALRHAVGKPIIHITSEIDNLPFDINSYNTIPYSNDMLGANTLKRDLKKAIEAINFENPIISNPIKDNIAEVIITDVPNEEKKYSDVLENLVNSVDLLNRKINMLSRNQASYSETFRSNNFNVILKSPDLIISSESFLEPEFEPKKIINDLATYYGPKVRIFYENNSFVLKFSQRYFNDFEELEKTNIPKIISNIMTENKVPCYKFSVMN